MQPLLVVLPYWYGEKEQLRELVAFAARLQELNGGPTRKVEWALVNRFDTPPDKVAAEILSKQFKVYLHDNPFKGTGWPAGCNAGVRGAADFVMKGLRSKRDRWSYVLLMESDTFPLTPDWTQKLTSFCDKRREGIAGVIVSTPGIPKHVNGSFIFRADPKIARFFLDVPSPSTAGWDVYLYRQLLRFGVVAHPGMMMIYRTTGWGIDDIRGWIQSGAVYFHGAKDRSVINAVEKIYGSARQIPEIPSTVE